MSKIIVADVAEIQAGRHVDRSGALTCFPVYLFTLPPIYKKEYAVLRKLPISFDPYLVLLLGLSLLALAPLFAPGYFYTTHDGRHSVFFASMFDEAFRDGALWPRWAMHHNQGYGYPTFVIQAPLAFYLTEGLILLGLGVTNAVKVGWALGFLLSGWGMYALVRTWLGESQPRAADHGVDLRSLAALVAGLFYIFAPYHLLDMYVRAAFAETMLIAWLPWVILAFERLIVQGAAPGWAGRLLLAAFSFGGLLLTHVFALPAVAPLVIGFVLFRLGRSLDTRKREWLARLGLAASAGVAGLLLAAIFILPLLAEGPLLAQEVFTTATYYFERHWIYPGQFLNPFWGYGYSDDPSGANDGMGFQLGLLHSLFLLVGAGMLLRRPSQQRGRIAFLLGISLVVLVAMTPLAAPIWRAISLLAVIQFPWRLLALSSFTLSALAGLLLGELGAAAPAEGRSSGVEAGILLIGALVLVASVHYAQPPALQPIEPWREDGRAVAQFEQEHPDMLGYTRQVLEPFTTSPMSDQYAAADFSNAHLARLGILQGTGEVISNYSRGESFGGEVVLAEAGVVQVRIYDFPGWQVRLDGQPVDFRTSPPYGLIELDVPAGRHQIDVRMGTTPVRTLGTLVSGGTVIVLLSLWLYESARTGHWTTRRRTAPSVADNRPA